MTYLGYEQLAGRQLPLAGVHLPVGVHLGALKLFAAVHQGLDLRLHLADVQTGHGELLLNDSIHVCQLSTGGRHAIPACNFPRFTGPPRPLGSQDVCGLLVKNP